ncbi:ankyrin repeat and fibronectin type-III domain-containing protein 1 isoform X2 [Esox lucius]|nr:ankyrin repeat and fibronectin type-III domain-containing protein 1 isoform X2 [Esox lucius]
MPKNQCKATPKYTTLWDAVENEDTLAVRSLLSRDRVCGGWEKGEKKEKDWEKERERDVNTVSEHGLVPLDVAALTQNSPLLHVLTKAGARHNPVLCQPDEWSSKLDALVDLAGRQVDDRREELLGRAGPGPQGQADLQRHLHIWTLRRQLYCKMRENFRCTDLPGPPNSVSLLVTSASSLFVSIQHSAGSTTGLITRYRVEWSTSADFKCILGSAQVVDTMTPVHNITGLTTGVHCFVRVSAYNVKGWGPPQRSSPVSAAPSSWKECIGVKHLSGNKETLVSRLLEQTREPRYRGFCLETSKPQSPSNMRLSMSRGLKLLFQSATKFVRLLQRGVYLATVFYNKETILVTADEQLPVVEILCCSTSITQDFLWFAKLSCAWQQVPWLQQALSTALSSSSSLLQNRQNILRAVAQLQSSVGTADLGQVYYEPLKDRQGNVLLVTMRDCAAHPILQEPPLHWVPLARLEMNRTRTPLHPEPTAMDILTNQLKEKLSYHRRSARWVQPGLYVGILKLCSTVEQIRVLVPQTLPNLLHHARVRLNSHVSRDEWTWLQSHNTLTASEDAEGEDAEGEDATATDGTDLGEFVRSLRTAINLLLTKLNIPLYRAYQFGVFTRELLQFGEKASMLLLLPPSEDFSSSYWPVVDTKEPGLTMPLQIFELVHFWTYERDFLSQYCQVWVRLELDAHLSQQALREALDTKEVQEARERLGHITQLSQRLEVVWREVRWIMDVLQCVRSKQWVGAVPLGLVMGGDPPARTEDEQDDRPTSRVWPQRLLSPKKKSESIACPVPDVAVTDGISEPVCIPGGPEEAMCLMEGASKCGYPMDHSAGQPVRVFNSLDQAGVGSDSVAQSEVNYHDIMPLSAADRGEQEYSHSCVSDVIPPLPELDTIFPTLRLIDREYVANAEAGSGEGLASLGLGVDESEPYLRLNSDLMSEGVSLSRLHQREDTPTSCLSFGDRACASHCAGRFGDHLDEQVTSAPVSVMRTTSAHNWHLPTEDPVPHDRGSPMPPRSLAEWVKSPSDLS